MHVRKNQFLRDVEIFVVFVQQKDEEFDDSQSRDCIVSIEELEIENNIVR